MTFRLPFVSRASHDEALALANRRADAEHENAQHLRRSLGELAQQYHELATRPLSHPVLTTPTQVIALEPKEPSAIAQTIREQCETADGHTDHALARHLRAYARQLKHEGKTDDEIVARLVEWQSSEPNEHAARMVEAS